MPAEMIHLACGWDAVLKAGLSGSVGDRGAFALGCQGPDVFSHNRRTRPLALAYARLLHRRLYGVFCANLASTLGSFEDASVLSWFLGFVTHAAVDRALHPYIISRSAFPGGLNRRDVDASRLHAFLERILDDRFVSIHPPLDSSPRWVAVPPKLSELLEAPLAEALAATYGDRAGDRVALRVRNAFHDSSRLYEVLSPERSNQERMPCPDDLAQIIEAGPNAVALLPPTGTMPDVDFLNLEREAWPDSGSGKPRFESVPQLASRAVEEAAAALEAVLAVVSGKEPPASLEEAIGNGCLSLGDETGLPLQVRYSSPFDLVPMLLEQTNRRAQWCRSSRSARVF